MEESSFNLIKLRAKICSYKTAWQFQWLCNSMGVKHFLIQHNDFIMDAGRGDAGDMPVRG